MYQPNPSAITAPAKTRPRPTLFIFGSLAAAAILFFAKPLFNSSYIFPWDFRYVQVPLISLLADQLHAGHFPLWDPYTYAGNPIYANIQACFFHPLVLPAALASTPDSLPIFLEWIVVAQVILAGCATYVLARDLGATRAGAWCAAVMCECGPYFASRTEHIGAMMSAAWMPIAWLAVCRLHRSPSSRWLALLAASLGMSILGGSPAATLAVFVSAFALALLTTRIRTIALAALGSLLGVTLAAVEFFPAAELTRNSVAKYRLDYLGSGGGLKLQSLVSLVLPDHFHIFHPTEFHGPGDPTFLYLYCGVLGLALALYALIRIRSRPVAAFAIMAALGCFWMLGDSTPLWRAVYPHLPERIRLAMHPEFTYCIFAESIAILAGLGLSQFPRTLKRQWLIAFIILADLYSTGSGRPMNVSSVRDEPGLTPHSIDGSRELLSRVRSRVDAASPPARIDTLDASIDWSECAPLTRVATSSGASPLAPERIIELRLAQTVPTLPHGGRAGTFYPADQVDSAAFDLLSERYLLVGSEAARAKPLSSAKWKPLETLPGNSLFENTHAIPRTFLVSHIEHVDPAGAFRFIRQPGRNFLQSAAVENAPDLALRPTPATGRAAFESYGNDELVIRTEAPDPSFLVVAEAWYPGWKAYVDDRETPIYPSDVAFRGLFIPGGAHRVRMEFRPTILPVSFAISALTLGVLILLAAKSESPT